MIALEYFALYKHCLITVITDEAKDAKSAMNCFMKCLQSLSGLNIDSLATLLTSR